MANTATLLYTLPARAQKAGPIKVYSVSIDTTGADLTICTPASGNSVYIVGLAVSEATAANVTIKSGSTTLWVAELAANQGILLPVENGFLMATAKGQALVLQSSAAVSNLLLHVVEAAAY